MNNEEMFLTILNRMDSMETSINGLSGRMDKLEGRMNKVESGLTGINDRIDKLETSVNDRLNKLEDKLEVEIFAVKKETEKVYDIAQGQFGVLNNKFDNFMYTKDVVEYDKIDIRVKVLENAYQKLMENNC